MTGAESLALARAHVAQWQAAEIAALCVRDQVLARECRLRAGALERLVHALEEETEPVWVNVICSIAR